MPNSQKRTQKTRQIRRLVILGLMLAFGLLANSPSNAQALDGSAIQKLAMQGTWAAEERDMGYWSWSEDNMVCLRLFGPDGDCADTGTWSIDGDVMCYELTWWGEGYQYRINCYTVHALGDGRFEALYHGGVMVSKFITFTVIK